MIKLKKIPPENIFLYVLLFAYNLSRPLVYFPDSKGYLENGIYRDPGYAWILDVLQMFPEETFELATVAFQSLIGIVAIHYFYSQATLFFKLVRPLSFLFALILAIPYLYNLNVANGVLSEAITYPLYLIFLGVLIRAWNSKKHLFLLSLLFFFLLITRTQFLFLIIPLLFVVIELSRKLTSTQKFKYAALYVGVIILAGITVRTYHYVKHDAFVSSPWTSIHLAAPLMFVAHEEDEKLFTVSSTEQLLFKKSFQRLKEHHLNIHFLLEEYQKEAGNFYHKNFPKIANHTLYMVGRNYFEENTDLTRDEVFLNIEEHTNKLILPLFKSHYKEWTQLYVKNVVLGFGNARYAFFSVLVFVLCGILFLKDREDKKLSVLFMYSSLPLLNVMFIAIGIYTIKRYTFYNDWVLFLMLLVICNEVWQRKKALAKAR